MDQCFDPYEEQLFKVFSSHDSDNDGSLDHTGLLQLCETLQLQDKSDDLITALLSNHHRSKATFPQFKDALLQLLGNMQNMQNGQNSPKDQNQNHRDNREKENRGKDAESCEKITDLDKDREVAPKYVVGSKKYGRRSRPRIDDSPINQRTSNGNGIQRSNSTADHTRPQQVRPIRLQRCTSVPSVTSYDETSFISNISASSMTDGCSEDMLREAWRKLGVGEDGYLNQNELILVFEAIGLDKLTDNVIRHLSHNSVLDYNKRISFQELLEALQKDDTWSHFLGDSQREEREIDRIGRNRITSFIMTEEIPHEKAVSIKLGPDGSGFISLEMITEMWESAGISSPKLLLKDLGFSTSMSIEVSELATILEKEIKSIKSLSDLRIDHTCNPLVALLQAFITIYQAEIKCLKSILQQVCEEKEKLKFDISEANNRATLLAQEVDENVLKMEQSTRNQMKVLESKHSEVLREVTDQCATEKEQLMARNEDLEEKIKTLENEELMLRDNLQSVQNYLGVVEGENKELASKVFELEEVKINLEQQIDELELEKLKVLETETIKSVGLLDEISVLQRENCVLKDKNDEMVCQIETLNKEIAIGRMQKPKSVNEEGINLDGIGLGAKRRNGETTNDELELECARSPRLGKMRKFHEAKEAIALDSSFTSTLSESDVDEGDGVTAATLRRRMAAINSLLRKYTVKLDCKENSEENYTKLLEQLIVHLLAALNDESASDFCAVIDPIERTPFVIPIPRADDPTIQSQKECNECIEKNEHNDCTNDVRLQLTSDYQTKIKTLQSENRTLQDKCDTLQQGLNLLRDEYEQCEDYWQKKLEDERAIYETEQLQSTEKLNEVLNKLTDYEEQIFEESKRLITIDESQIEKQYTDLEAEYEEFKSRAQHEFDEQESLIVSLKDQLEIKVNEVSLLESKESKMSNLVYTKVHFDCYIPPPDEIDLGRLSWPKMNKVPDIPPSIPPFLHTSSCMKNTENTVMPLKTKKNRRHVRSLTQPARNLKRCTSSDSSDNSVGCSQEQKVSVQRNEVQMLEQHREHMQKRCMELQSELKYHKRLYEELCKSYSRLYHSCRGELQHAYTKLDQQFRLAAKLHEKLADNDVLVGNLYIENAYLIKNNQRLEQQLQMLTGQQEPTMASVNF